MSQQNPKSMLPPLILAATHFELRAIKSGVGNCGRFCVYRGWTGCDLALGRIQKVDHCKRFPPWPHRDSCRTCGSTRPDIHRRNRAKRRNDQRSRSGFLSSKSFVFAAAAIIADDCNRIGRQNLCRCSVEEIIARSNWCGDG